MVIRCVDKQELYRVLKCRNVHRRIREFAAWHDIKVVGISFVSLYYIVTKSYLKGLYDDLQPRRVMRCFATQL